MYENREQNDDIVQESSTTERRSNFGFPPWLCQRGKTPSQFLRLAWHFVSLALFIQGHLIDRILTHFWWILVGRPPLLQPPWPTQTSRAGYDSRALQTKKIIHTYNADPNLNKMAVS